MTRKTEILLGVLAIRSKSDIGPTSQIVNSSICPSVLYTASVIAGNFAAVSCYPTETFTHAHTHMKHTRARVHANSYSQSTTRQPVLSSVKCFFRCDFASLYEVVSVRWSVPCYFQTTNMAVFEGKRSSMIQ